ncbi:MAG: hypothetical protein ACLQHF_08495 [Terracidiphilus sp.]
MRLDLRIPMGLMFTMVGAILTAFGLATRENSALYAKSLGVDANLWWGVVLLVFGIVMLTLGRRGQKRLFEEEQKSPYSEESKPRRGH